MDAGFIDLLSRFGHILFGICWIGLLYYFNFVQTEYIKVGEAAAKVDVLSKLAPRALWWFRWAAMFTFITGVILLGLKGAGITLDIAVGATLATLMFLNVWLIIWPNQKIVVGSNQQVAAGGQADPAAAAAGPKAALASRTNTMFSIPMLLFMVSSAHLPNGSLLQDPANMMPFVVALVIIAGLEANAIFGKQGFMTTVRGVISCGAALAVVLWGVVTLL